MNATAIHWSKPEIPYPNMTENYLENVIAKAINESFAGPAFAFSQAGCDIH